MLCFGENFASRTKEIQKTDVNIIARNLINESIVKKDSELNNVMRNFILYRDVYFYFNDLKKNIVF